MIEKLSGNIWTNYNTHDPGVTLLEALCYALTDLGYRTSFEIKDLLAPDPMAEEETGQIFYSASQILPCNPVTITDYRKLVIDTDGIKNAWIETSNDYEVLIYLTSRTNEKTEESYKLAYDGSAGDEPLSLKGLYKVTIEYEEDVNSTEKKDEVLRRLHQKLNAHRNLCEDFLSITPVEFELFKMEAEVHVREESDIEKINAQIFQVINNFFSPSVNFYTLKQMIEKGYSTEAIFEGPSLKNGFIDTNELEDSERFKNVHLSDIVSLVSDIEGVIAITKCVFPIETQSAFSDFAQWIDDIKERKKTPKLDIENSVITFTRSGDRYRNKDEHQPNRDRVKSVYQFLQAGKKSTKLKGINNNISIPQGEYMDLADYSPFQNLLPSCYGLQEYITNGATDDALLERAMTELLERETNHGGRISEQTQILDNIVSDLLGKSLKELEGDDERTQVKGAYKKYLFKALPPEKKQALQLRGFLMVFEQILADYLSQLGNIKHLFSFNSAAGQTYFPQVLKEINDMELLFIDTYDAAHISRLSETEALSIKRKDSILNHVLARFGENMDNYGAKIKSGQKEQNKININDKAAFLSDYIGVSNYRGSGFNYHKADQIGDKENVIGFKKRICRLLGINDYSTRFSTADKVYIERLEYPNKLERYVAIVKHPEREEILLRSNEYDTVSEVREVLDHLLQHGFNKKNYEVDPRKNKYTYGLKKYSQEDDYDIIASNDFKNSADLERSFESLLETLNAFSSNENFHVIEHILLRPRIDKQYTVKTKGGGRGNSDTVNLLAVPKFTGIKLSAGKEAGAIPYRFEIESINDPNINDRTVWRLKIKKGEAEILYAEDDFIFKNYLTKRIEHLRSIATDKENYITEEIKDDRFIFRIKDKEKILVVSKKHYQKEEINKEIDDLVKFFSYESVQTAKQSEDDTDDAMSYADPYSFQISIIIPNWPRRFRDPGFKHLLEKAIYMETPAHIYAHVYWLDYHAMSDFESTYREWLEAISEDDIPDTAVLNSLIDTLNKLSEAD